MNKKHVSVVLQLNAFLLLAILSMLAIGALAWPMIPAGDRPRFLLLASAIAVVFTLAGVVLRLGIRHGILRSIRAAAHVVSRVAEGDLTARIEIQSQGETQKMLQGLQRMTADLARLVGEVFHSADTVAAGTAQLAAGHRELAARTEQEASTLEETASSMEELASTVAHNAEAAREASHFAQEAAELAGRGGGVVADVVRTMGAISSSAGRIREISSVIDGIAFQTNLLALNAAVEAARAGEQGRGFAVVAAEVRTLAQNSAAAAKEIKALIAQAVHDVQSGSELVDHAGASMREVVTAVHKVSELIAGIAGASQQQSVGIGQVNNAVAQLEHGVQQNASMADEASRATEAIHAQVQRLLELVSRFRLGEARGA